MTTKEVIENFSREEGIALFNAKKTDKEIYDLCVAKGLTDDFETFSSETQKLFNEKISAISKEELLAQIDGAELTDEQLEQIAGGKEDNSNSKLDGLDIAAIAIGGGLVAVSASFAAGF